jgi:hypothetical protein
MQHTYTKREKKQFVKLLEAAKTRLWDGHGGLCYLDDKEKYICHAISPAFQRETTSVVKLREYISYMLHGFTTVEYWLAKQRIISLGDIGSVRKDIEIQQYRLDWIDHMIQEFSK